VDVAWRHLPFLVLVGVLLVISSRTLGVYLLSDDLKWVERTVADARRPWRAFGAPLFANYYRPVPHLVWLVNYYIWGFDFAGHHAMFLAMWVAALWLLYGVGCRLGGRVAGLTAAALVGFNDVYLLIASWKSWYTTQCELAAVLAWAWFYMAWLKGRRRRDLVLWCTLAGVGPLSRELAPLVISACVLATAVLPLLRKAPCGVSKRRAWLTLAAWALLSAAALLALPSYRSAAKALLSFGHPADASVETVGSIEVSRGHIPSRLATHTHSMLSFGLSKYLLLFAVAISLARSLRLRERLGGRYGRTMLGALLIGVAILAVPGSARASGEGGLLAYPGNLAGLFDLILLAGFVAAGFAGDRWERMLAAWFVAAYGPIMVLAHSSNAYHVLAFAALALYAGKTVGAFRIETRRRRARRAGRVPRVDRHRPGSDAAQERATRRADRRTAREVGQPRAGENAARGSRRARGFSDCSPAAPGWGNTALGVACGGGIRAHRRAHAPGGGRVHYPRSPGRLARAARRAEDVRLALAHLFPRDSFRRGALPRA